ncbi:MAG: hypothetical protein U0401_11245 [Anaerolineae bacterium]
MRTTGVMTNTWDAANRLITTQRVTATVQPIYNGVGDRVVQTIGATTTNFALDCAPAPFRAASALPEVIYTSAGESYLHLPGVIMTELCRLGRGTRPNTTPILTENRLD